MSLDTLAHEVRWVAWRNESRGGKLTKIPYAPGGGKAAADDPATWGTRTEAEATAAKIVNGLGGGVGIELGDLGGDQFLAGIDLDSCIEVVEGHNYIADWAQAIIEAAPTYGEQSPSGTGVKLFALIGAEDVRPFLNAIGVLPESWGCRRSVPGHDGSNHGPAVEVYCAGRYFAVTGKPLESSPVGVMLWDRPVLDRLVDLVPPPRTNSASGASEGDGSRSAKAFRKGAALRRAGKTFDEMVEALRSDPKTADWVREKGMAFGQRELRRIWERAAQSDPRGQADGHGDVLIQSGDGLTMEKIEWLWPGWLARGKFHLLAGGKGAGKSTILFDLMARLTAGANWPDGKPAPPGDVMVWSGEDGIRDTILPRFYAAGGIRSRIHFPTTTRINGAERPFDPSTDIGMLIDAVHRLPDLSLVTIDPVVLALPVRSDSHKNTETRRGLQPLVDFAEQRGIALMGITHFTKGTEDRDPVERVTGSLAFGALPRCVWGASADDDGRQRRLVRIASNIGPSGGGFEYTLFQAPLVDHDFSAQRVDWGKKLTGSARELLNATKRSAEGEAAAFLTTFLADGPKPQREIKEAADAHCHSWATIRRAQEKLGIKPKKNGKAWDWERPRQATWQDAHDPTQAAPGDGS